jgi:molybdopterin molybdotransferase
VFVRPAIRKLLGYSDLNRPRIDAVSLVAFDSPPGRRQYVRAKLEPNGTPGRAQVRPTGGAGSHLMAALARSDCLIVIPEDTTGIEIGDHVSVITLEAGS